MTKLPKILALVLDADFAHITCDYDTTERVLGILISGLIMSFNDRKSQTSDNAHGDNEPKILVMKPSPKSKNHDLDGEEHNRW